MSSKTNNIWISRVVIACIVGVIGVIFLIVGQAATPSVSKEAESGTISSCAAGPSDTKASGGKAVKFTSCLTGNFVHPGILVNQQQLDLVKTKVHDGVAPWSTIFNKASSADIATRPLNVSLALDQSLQPVDTSKPCDPDVQDSNCKACDPSVPNTSCIVDCGTMNVVDHGCTAEEKDAAAAYTQVLLWYYSGQESYAQSAIAILNGWSAVLKAHASQDGALIASWSAEDFVRAAEILRYEYTPSAGKTAFNVTQFTSMLNTAFKPIITQKNFAAAMGNQDLSATDALMEMGVFLDDHSLFNSALTRWRARVPSYIYLTSDGTFPVLPPGGYIQNTKTSQGCFWIYSNNAKCNTNPRTDPGTTYQNGQIQESCRDFEHVGMGLASMLDSAETAWIQGIDLYGEQQARIMAGIEYTTEMLVAYPVSTTSNGYPPGFCVSSNLAALQPPDTLITFEVAYNAYTVRKHVAFQPLAIPGLDSGTANPVLTYLKQIDCAPISRYNGAKLMIVWETLSSHTTDTCSQ